MPVIQLLDQATINQIAAGEVIDRPASVVKELFENAVDAKATAVTVEIKEGGISLIRVTDNGCGIDKDQIALAFKRHATSKIHDIMDLVTVSSLGFRGEALSSIAAVAQVEMITKPAQTMLGVSYQIEDGEEKQMQEIGAPDGTTILVRNLFGHVPARRKFLKTAATEGSHIAQLMENMALSRPDLSVRFINNGQNKLYTTGNGRLHDLIYTIYGREIASNLLEIEVQTELFHVKGYLGKPIISRGNRSFENYFINGRFVKSALIAKAIETGYKSFMMQHRYPFTALYLTIDPELIDVNVHPAKMEIRFRDGEQIYRTVYHTIAMALANRELIPAVSLEDEKNAEKERQIPGLEKGVLPELPTGKMESSQGSRPSLKPVRIREEHPEPFETKRLGASQAEMMSVSEDMPGYGAENGSGPNAAVSGTGRFDEVFGRTDTTGRVENVSINAESDQPKPTTSAPSSESISASAGQTTSTASVSTGAFQSIPPEKPRQMDLFEDKLLSKPARANHRLIGQLFDTYWLVEYHDNLYIIDQHAAHEKILYERTMASLQKREYTSQMIDPPIILSLNSSEQLKLEQYMEHFTSIGFEIEPFGGKEYAVRAVPANLFSVAKRELLMEMIDDLAEGNGSGTPDLINERVATMSCKAAVKGNHTLSFAEADKLIDELLELKNPYACPHGRPTIISMSKYELEKKFKRIV